MPLCHFGIGPAESSSLLRLSVVVLSRSRSYSLNTLRNSLFTLPTFSLGVWLVRFLIVSTNKPIPEEPTKSNLYISSIILQLGFLTINISSFVCRGRQFSWFSAPSRYTVISPQASDLTLAFIDTSPCAAVASTSIVEPYDTMIRHIIVMGAI